MSLDELARIVSGKVVGNGQIRFASVAIDSRSIEPGQLFTALRGERFDGHDFLADVGRRGIDAALVEANTSDIETRLADAGISAVLVDDTRMALGRFAQAWRQRFDPILVAITGSNGKTTTKEMIACIFAQAMGAEHVLATEGNLNNDIGMPLTLLRMNDGHNIVIVEIGMNHPGEIIHLGKIAQPTVAVVTNAQRAHLAGMGAIEAVAFEKGSIFSLLPPGGVAVINRDDRFAPFWRQLAGDRAVFTYSTSQDAEKTGVDLCGQIVGHALSTRLHLSVAGKQIETELKVPGLHNAQNALAAAAVSWVCGLGLEQIAAGLALFTGVKGRLQSKRTLHGTLILDDTYNANPDSVRAAIDVLAAMIGRKLLVLGDMGEIGEMSGQCHDEIGGYAKSQGIDTLFTLGDQAAIAARNFGSGAKHFRNRNDLVAALDRSIDSNTIVLVKGSRFMKMEQIVEALLNEGKAANAEAESTDPKKQTTPNPRKTGDKGM